MNVILFKQKGPQIESSLVKHFKDAKDIHVIQSGRNGGAPGENIIDSLRSENDRLKSALDEMHTKLYLEYEKQVQIEQLISQDKS